MKIIERIKDAFVAIGDKAMDVYYSIRNFFNYKLRRSHLNVVKEAFNGYPYDFEFMLELEYAKLKEMLDYHERSHIICEEERKRIIWQLKLAISLLEIISEKRDIFHYDFNENQPLLKEKCEFGYKLLEDFDSRYHCDVNVNTRNVDRFAQNEWEKGYMLKSPHELYMMKARHLYYRVREQYEQEWWD